jgi:hypothetical protein
MSFLAAIRKLWHSLTPRTHSDVEEEQSDPLTYLYSIRAAIASISPDQQISTNSFNGTVTLNQALERDPQYRSQRLFSILFGLFSAMALALGAPRAHVLLIAARMALVSAAAGIVIGLACDSFLGPVLAHWMASDFAARSLFTAAALLALSALLACLLPARHAAAIPPAEALRNE